MITNKENKIWTLFLVVVGFLCLLLLRYSQSDIIKITMLHTANICAMLSVISYKKSINKYEISIFCFLCVQYLFTVTPGPSSMNDIVSTSYLLSYRYGASSRSLIPTIIDFFTNGGFISKYFVWNFIFCTTIFLSFIISVYLGTIIQRWQKDNDLKIFTIFLTLLYLSCFVSPAAYYGVENFGRFEIFAFLFMLILVVIIDKPIIRWLVPLLALLVLATHIMFVIMYIPFVIIMLLYEIFTKTGEKKQSILLLAVTLLIIFSALLLYVLFYKQTFVFGDAQSFSEYLSTKTDLIFNKNLVHAMMYSELQDHKIEYNSRVSVLFSGNLTILINIPLIILFIFFWLKCYFNEKKKIMKFFFLLPILILPFQSLTFFMFFDFGRYIIMMLSIQFMLIFYFIYVKNETVLLVARKTIPFIKRNAFFIILIFLTMMFLGPITEIAPGERIFSAFQRYGKIINKILGH